MKRLCSYAMLIFVIILIFTLAVSCDKPFPSSKTTTAELQTEITTARADVGTDDGITKTPTKTADRNVTYPHQTTTDLASVLERQDEILSRLNNRKPYDELIKKTVDIDAFLQKFEPSPYGLTAHPSIVDIDENIGIECLRKSESGKYYSVHELKQGGLLYLFYISYSDEDPLWLHTWFVSQKSLSYADFSGIAVGSTLEAVKAIDPVASIYEQRVKTFKPAVDVLYTQHYLTDGILTIYYSYDDGKGSVKIIDYQKDFQIFHWWWSESPEYKGRILETDAVQ